MHSNQEEKAATSSGQLVYGQSLPASQEMDEKKGNAIVTVKSSNSDEGKDSKTESKNPRKFEKKDLVKFSALFRYATKGEVALMVLSSVCAAAVGCVFPLFTIIFGQMLDILNDPAQASNPNAQADKISSLCIYFLIIAIVSSICSAVENYIPVYVTENVLTRVRHEFMKALLRQDMEWFDTNRGGEATSRLAEGTIQMSSGGTFPLSKIFGSLILWVRRNGKGLLCYSDILYAFLRHYYRFLDVLATYPCYHGMRSIFCNRFGHSDDWHVSE